MRHSKSLCFPEQPDREPDQAIVITGRNVYARRKIPPCASKTVMQRTGKTAWPLSEDRHTGKEELHDECDKHRGARCRIFLKSSKVPPHVPFISPKNTLFSAFELDFNQKEYYINDMGFRTLQSDCAPQLKNSARMFAASQNSTQGQTGHDRSKYDKPLADARRLRRQGPLRFGSGLLNLQHLRRYGHLLAHAGIFRFGKHIFAADFSIN